MKVLFIDDLEYPVFLGYLKLFFGENNVFKFNNNFALIKDWLSFRGNEIDLAIIDQRMGDLEGTEVGEWINEHYPHIACVILAGHSDFVDSQKAIRSGFCDFILKSGIVDSQINTKKELNRILELPSVKAKQQIKELVNDKEETRKAVLNFFSQKRTPKEYKVFIDKMHIKYSLEEDIDEDITNMMHVWLGITQQYMQSFVNVGENVKYFNNEEISDGVEYIQSLLLGKYELSNIRKGQNSRDANFKEIIEAIDKIALSSSEIKMIHLFHKLRKPSRKTNEEQITQNAQLVIDKFPTELQKYVKPQLEAFKDMAELANSDFSEGFIELCRSRLERINKKNKKNDSDTINLLASSRLKLEDNGILNKEGIAVRKILQDEKYSQKYEMVVNYYKSVKNVLEKHK